MDLKRLHASLMAQECQGWILVRHGERDTKSSAGEPWLNPLSAAGLAASLSMGREMCEAGLTISSLASSPLLRCTQTAQGIAEGHGSPLGVRTSDLLGNPGPFVTERMDLGLFQTLTVRDLVDRLTLGPPVEGVRDLRSGTRLLMEMMVIQEASGAGVGVLVSHDAVIVPVLRCLTDLRFDRDRWIGFLDGFGLVRTGSDWTVLHDGSSYDVTERIEDLVPGPTLFRTQDQSAGQ